ncbi:MAG: M20/M25/M40 family metallo-hydrolase, partial [Trueperaceae bacterium]
LKRCGVDLDRMNEAHAELANAGAYLELHIEQGPVLLDMDLPLGVVLGTYGVERHAFKFVGQAAHSGSTPMNRRRDAFLAAGKMSQEIYDLTDALGGVSTIGSCVTRPGIVTSVVAECDITLDQRHLDRQALTRMYQWAVDASQRFAEEGGVEASTEVIWRIDPMPFHPELIDMADEAVKGATGGLSHRLPSGPLHDAAEVARAGIPTVMLFTQSLHGISHNKIEDTKEEHIEMSVVALDALAEKTMAWLLAGGASR